MILMLMVKWITAVMIFVDRNDQVKSMNMSSDLQVTGPAIETFMLGNPDPGYMAQENKCH